MPQLNLCSSMRVPRSAFQSSVGEDSLRETIRSDFLLLLLILAMPMRGQEPRAGNISFAPYSFKTFDQQEHPAELAPSPPLCFLRAAWGCPEQAWGAYQCISICLHDCKLAASPL